MSTDNKVDFATQRAAIIGNTFEIGGQPIEIADIQFSEKVVFDFKTQEKGYQTLEECQGRIDEFVQTRAHWVPNKNRAADEAKKDLAHKWNAGSIYEILFFDNGAVLVVEQKKGELEDKMAKLKAERSQGSTK
ncbi:uncharacterized protein SPPG_06030 [Spizellomyces punctatus DAOM BR117]|uniref:Uncharacterized protein n=1 Tax=Spizellomyces punctatus (strain DAOM BR117) TaxID=645134 RepID=A0A0L0HEC2_SPIPD|nr:uncharacterized protein SPPG_06030 [Spizellomyces punctatus DAOM BR117]KNC99083.1 hypothetical protein SPPG_06030 [Spizellomyces punctatus DAOM BR117]|eukprot:XP_016607123.1 hypothetical protein SPPG_06030 [Spizellomyces punctatus DAOM BR117]